jgi:outer membrane protein OmpA-like peptidoglycan-associated protein
VATNLIELLTKELGGDTLGRLAGLLGEPESKVQTAAGGIAPALVATLANKASSGGGLADLFNLMKSSGFDGTQAKSLGSVLDGGGGGMADLVSKGAPLMASLLGGRQAALTDWLATFSGIGATSAGSLLGLAAPTLLNLLGGTMSKGGGFTQAALAALGGSFKADAFTAAMNLAVINFASGSAEIPADSQDLIARAAVVLKTAPKGTVIEVGGHTDNTGDPAANQKLSEDRANAVRNALTAAGVPGTVLVARGYGDTKPVASNDTEYGRFRNRRIEYAIATTPAK